MISYTVRDCPWTYGVRSPSPAEVNSRIYGGFIVVRTPEELPKLNSLVAIWASVSSNEWFYQTSLGYRVDKGWHISAGACRDNESHPQLPGKCGCACPPFTINGEIFRPEPNHLYELGIRFVPKKSSSGYEVHLYFVDISTNTLYDIFVLDDNTLPSTPVGGMLESPSTNSEDLLKVGNNNAFKIEDTNWLLEPWVSERWPHGFVHADFKDEEKDIEKHIQIKLLSPGKLYIGYDIGGKHYETGERLW